jgi:tetratricopeptide (TPR) repeat protein
MTIGDPGYERERELERLLAQANLHRLRGQLLEAEDTCRKALELNTSDVIIREMLGDVLIDAGKLQAALAEYRTALGYAPGKDSLEKKFAKATLGIADNARQKAMAQDMMFNPHKYAPRERNQAIAFFSGFIPGLGQLYNGDIIKSAVIFGSFLLFMLSYALLQQPYPEGIDNLQMFLYLTNPLVQIMGVRFGLAYIYGLVDAPITAGKTVKKPAAKKPEPPA